jgi:carbonyl reductase 1
MTSRIALVTGATQGLGLALVRRLAARVSESDVVLLNGRDRHRVDIAAGSLTGRATVRGELLDVTDDAAVAELSARIEREYGGIDLVVSNASSRQTPDRSPAEQIDSLIETNNLGAHRMLRHFVPLLRPRGRFLVVSSSFGTLGHLDPALRSRYDDAETLEDLERVLEDWRTAVHAGTAEQQGFPYWSNIPSKVEQVAAVRVIARQRREHDLTDGTLIASVCPGLVDTDASRPWFEDMSQAQTPDEAAVAILDLLLAPEIDSSQYGELVRFGRVLPWHAGVDPQTADGVVVQRAEP